MKDADGNGLGVDEAGGKAAFPISFGWMCALTLVLFLVAYVMPLGHRPLFIPDETRYGEIPREMVAGGDWLRLRQNGLDYYEKPPLGYWFTAASLSVFGNRPFAVRLPSALSVGVAALALFLLVRRARPDSFSALAAAMVYITGVGVFGIGTIAVLDSQFTMFVVASMAAFYWGDSGTGRRRLLWLALSGVFCALAFMTKGFTAVVIPAVTLAAWLPWERRWKELATVWVVPLLSAAVVSVPFVLAMHAGNDDFWHYFVWVEHVQRFVAAPRGQHPEPFWYYLPVIAALALPWFFFLPAVVQESVGAAKRDSFTRYCICWTVMPFLFFSVCSGKLGTYVLPCLAPLAALAADAILNPARAGLARRCALAGGAILLIAMAGFVGWVFIGGDEEPLRRAVLDDPVTFGLVAAILAAVACLYVSATRFGAGLSRRGLIWFAIAVLPVALGSIYFVPRQAEDRKSPTRLLEYAVPRTPPNAVLLGDSYSLAAVSWYYERTDAVVIGNAGENWYGVQRANPPGSRHAEKFEDAAALVRRELAAGRPVAACLRDDRARNLLAAMGDRAPDERRDVTTYVWLLYLPREADG